MSTEGRSYSGWKAGDAPPLWRPELVPTHGRSVPELVPREWGSFPEPEADTRYEGGHPVRGEGVAVSQFT